MIEFGSICSGIEAASVAWEPLGMRAAWFAEIEKFPSAVLAHHWPNVPNMGDMTLLPEFIRRGLISAPPVLVGGTPCQAFSVAGKRGGLSDERGQLTLSFVELANAIDEKRETGDECVVVWENVPGVLSSKDNAFGCFLAELCGETVPLEPPGGKWSNAGYVFGPERAIAWRVLDAQYFGVAQRRRRVFVVASARKGFDPCQVLFESEGLRRDSPPSREEGPSVAALTANGVGTCGADDNQGQAGHLICMAHGQGGAEIHRDGSPSLNCNHEAPLICGVSDEQAHTLRGEDRTPVIAFSCKDDGRDCTADQTPTLRAMGGTRPNGGGQNTPLVRQDKVARRLTPVECERLQGFPDNHTRIPWRNKTPEDCPDGPRYKAIGNSKAVPVVQWLGHRLLKELRS